MSSRPPYGTPEYALFHATQVLGAEVVERITGHSRSAVYRGTNRDDPLGISWLTLEMAVQMAGLLMAEGRAEYFSSALRRQAEQQVPPSSADGENPLAVTAGAIRLLGETQGILAEAGGASGLKLSADDHRRIVEKLQQAGLAIGRVREHILSLAP